MIQLVSADILGTNASLEFDVGFAPTAEQTAIVDASVDGRSLVIDAKAGAGKTSTLIEIARANPDSRMCYLAFNKAIATEAIDKFAAAGAKNVEVRTAHSFAYRAVGKNMRDRLVQDSWAIKTALEPRIGPPIAAVAQTKEEVAAYKYAVLSTINRFQQSADMTIGLKHVPAKAREELQGGLIASLASESWNEMTREGSSLPVTHDTYFKMWQLGKPRLPHDTILFDEAQDSSPVMLDVVERQKGAQKIYVGDPHQAIYAWRGAVDAIESLATSGDLPKFPLSQSWRFGQEIADVANRILDVKGEKNLIVGAPLREGKEPGQIVVGTSVPDVILTRTNAGIVREAITQLANGRTVGIVGGVNEIAAKMLGAYELATQDHTNIRFYSEFSNWNDLVVAAQTDDGAQFAPFVRMVEEYGPELPGIVTQLKTECVSPETADVTLCTAHKFKGQERKVVALSSDFRDFCTQDEKTGKITFDKAEANLVYVAVTRAEQVLDLGGFAAGFESSIALAKVYNAQREIGASELEVEPAQPSLREALAAAEMKIAKPILALIPTLGTRITGELLFAGGEPGQGGVAVVDHGRRVILMTLDAPAGAVLAQHIGKQVTMQAEVSGDRNAWRDVTDRDLPPQDVEISR